ncbi:MAG: bifunctional UDP-sugar hydrolase/5'-nucleotidase [Clostridiales bacterium]|nr:bifunctional UDP-sugar hydrolase/5'-nucleotidase [Clostridiales bacterium]
MRRRFSLMKKNCQTILAVILAVALASTSACKPRSEEIVILFSHDTHGTFEPYKLNQENGGRLVGGMEATSHYLNEIRAKEKNVFVIEAGDVLTGTLASEIKYRGADGGAMIEFLNRLGYDVWCFGNHDFDKGQKNALALSKLAGFPTVMANIVYKKSGKLFAEQPYHIFDVGRIKLGVICVMEEHFLSEVQQDKVEGLAVEPIIPTLKSHVPEIDRQTDLIVVVSHGWFSQGVQIAENVPGVDIVLAAAEDGKFAEVNGVLVKSTFGHQRTMGYLKVKVKNDAVRSYEQDLIWLWADIDLKPSPGVAELVREIEESIDAEYAKVIGEAKMNLSAGEYPGTGGHGESNLGNWITDVMRWKTKAQIAFHNSRGIRADIAAGPVKRGDIFNTSPFHNSLVVFNLSGRQIKEALEHDVERGWDRLQVSGIKYRYYPKQARPYGERVFQVEADGEILVKSGRVLLPDKTYTVVANDYLASQAREKYFGFAVENLRNTGFPLDMTLMEWLEKHRVIDSMVEGRIVEIKK